MKLFPKSIPSLQSSPSSFRQLGQAIAEFALMLPVLLMILFVLIEGALVIQGYLTVQYAAREAARWAVTYRPVQGETIDEVYCTNLSAGDSVEAFLGTEAGYNCDPYESDAEYHNRRVALIKETAVQRAAGLRINGDALALSDDVYRSLSSAPGFFGVKATGATWAGDATAFEDDHPGLPGLQVRVEVVHRVALVDPFLRVIAPNGVRVRGQANMVNEGVQVWQPSPTPLTTTPGAYTAIPSPTPRQTYTPTPPPATSTPPPGGYRIDILFDYVTNTLPFERGHTVDVLVTDINDNPLPDVLVSFSTDAGAYDYSGVPDPQDQYAEDMTGGDGIARRRVYANRPVTATLRAWVDLDGDNTLDAGEVNDVATKAWLVPEGVPYILASSYEVAPLEVILVDIYNHDPLGNPYTLLWCRTTMTGGLESAVLYNQELSVDMDGDLLEQEVEIPMNSAGHYRLETHPYPGGACTPPGSPPETCLGTACSAEIRMLPLPPDLVITDISYPEAYGDVLPSNEDIPFTVRVENLLPWPVEDVLYDIDLYVDPPVTPTLGQIGDAKQWLSHIEAYGTEELTLTLSLAPGIHELWAQVDTTNYVEEQDETNNMFGPYEVEADCTVDSTPYGDDFNDGSFSGKWSQSAIGSGVNGSVTESGDGELQIHALGASIWGNSDNFFFVHQSVVGNFDARLRVVSPPPNAGAKLGLMVRNSGATNSRHVLAAARDADGARLQFAYREQDGGSTDYASRELNLGAIGEGRWLRIVRRGSDFRFYYSDAEVPASGDWVYGTSVTVGMNDAVLVGLAHAKYSSSGSPYTSRADEFLVCQGGDPLAGYDAPGLRECTQLFEVGGFEGNPERVGEYWRQGATGAATQRGGYLQYEGAFSMRLHASLGSYPACMALDPWVAQTVQIPPIPAEVLTLTHVTVEGYQAVGGSLADCSVYNSTDSEDLLYVELRDRGGASISDPITITDGGGIAETWRRFNADFTDDVDLESLAGQDVTVRFFATQDADEYGTWFYLDNVECNICSEWPVPDEEPGTASFGGLVRGMTGAVPQILTGVKVMAYSQGGRVYRTLSIHDGTYHFYNKPPGTYIIYAEAWAGNHLLVDSTSVTVVSDERNYAVNLLLQ